MTTPPWARRLVERWAQIRAMGSGMISTVLLPCAGGYMDQPAAMLDAFRLFDGWMAERKSNGEHSA